MTDYPVFASADDIREGQSLGRASTADEAVSIVRQFYSDDEARKGGWEWAGAELVDDVELGVTYPRSDTDREKATADACRYHKLEPSDLWTASGNGNSEIQYLYSAWVGLSRDLDA